MIRWAFKHQVSASATHTSPGFRHFNIQHGVTWNYLRNNLVPVSRDTYLFAHRLHSSADLSPDETVWPGDTLVLRRHCTAPRKYINLPPYKVTKTPLKVPVMRVGVPDPAPAAVKAAEIPPPRRSARIAARKKKTKSKATSDEH